MTEHTGNERTGWFQKPTIGEIVGGVLFVLVMAFFLYRTTQQIDSNPTHALFWFGGAILACETALSFLDYQGRKGAIAALVLRGITFFSGYAALILT